MTRTDPTSTIPVLPGQESMIDLLDPTGEREDLRPPAPGSYRTVLVREHERRIRIPGFDEAVSEDDPPPRAYDAAVARVAEIAGTTDVEDLKTKIESLAAVSGMSYLGTASVVETVLVEFVGPSLHPVASDGAPSLPVGDAPRARTTDPETSRVAAASSNPTRLQKIVLEVLDGSPPMIDEEIHSKAEKTYLVSPSGLRTARLALELAGMVAVHRDSEGGVMYGITKADRDARRYRITPRGREALR